MNWTVTDQEADYILKVLAQRPYTEVGELIPNLVRQSQPVAPAPAALPLPE